MAWPEVGAERRIANPQAAQRPDAGAEGQPAVPQRRFGPVGPRTYQSRSARSPSQDRHPPSRDDGNNVMSIDIR